MRRNRYFWFGVAALALLAVTIGSVFAFTRHGTTGGARHGNSLLASTGGPARRPLAARPPTHGVAIHPMANHRLKGQPACPPPTGTSPTTLAITAAGANFTESCYYVAAGQELTINFTSSVVATGDNTPIPLTLLISPSQNPAITPIPGTPMGTESEANADFVGTPVSAPDTATLSVPALTAGTYDLQILQLQNFIATLVVQ